jgi:D-sedoheptulose 7-phosphate isomerase
LKSSAGYNLFKQSFKFRLAMSLSQRIQDQFQISMQALIDAADLLSEPIEQSVQMITDCLMHEGRILTCGSGAAGLLAQHTAAILVDKLDKDRPGLAAIALSGSGSAMVDTDTLNFSRQLIAIGQPGDILLAISTFGQSRAVIDAARTAQERDMVVIALVGGEGGALAEILRENDVLICAPVVSPARVHETLLLSVHCLCDGVDFLLLGA